MKKFIITAGAMFALATGTAFADDAHHVAGMSDGEVRKVDKDNNRITLKHGEIKNLGMPGMTMVFRVKDASLLDKVQPGAKVRFVAEKADGNLVVTAIERVD